MQITSITRQINDLQRFIQVLSILVKYGFGYVVDKLPLDRTLRKLLSKAGMIKHAEKLDIPLAQRIRKVAQELGPTFIKLGQILSQRPDLIPENICKELEKLQAQVPAFPYDLVRDIVIDQLGRPPEELFAEFEKKPFAGASLSQVHKARLDDGQLVAVKIQRPGIVKIINSDLEILSELARFADKYVEETKPYDLPGIVRQLKKGILRETDFTIEVRNIEHFTENFANVPDVHFMKVFRHLCSEKIITMEFIDGVKIDDLGELTRRGYNPSAIAKIGAKAVLKQVFDDGFFHADPHPGNILAIEGNKIAFIDFGMVGRFDRTTQDNLTSLLYAVFKKDIQLVLNVLARMSVIDEFFDSADFRIDLLEVIERYHNIPLNRICVEKILKDFNQLINSYKLKIPEVFTLFTKALVTIEGVGRKLDPDFNLTEQTAPFVEKLIKRRYSPENLYTNLKYFTLDVLSLAKVMPKELRHLFYQVRKGRLKIDFEHKGLEPALVTIAKISNNLVLAIVLAAIIISSALIMLSKIPPLWKGIPVLGILGFALAGMIGLLLGISLISSKTRF